MNFDKMILCKTLQTKKMIQINDKKWAIFSGRFRVQLMQKDVALAFESTYSSTVNHMVKCFT